MDKDKIKEKVDIIADVVIFMTEEHDDNSEIGMHRNNILEAVDDIREELGFKRVYPQKEE